MNIQIRILRRLFNRKVIGEKHTAFENVASGFPKHLIGDAKKNAEILIRQGLILTKPTSYGLQISLNNERLEEIIQIIDSDKSNN